MSNTNKGYIGFKNIKYSKWLTYIKFAQIWLIIRKKIIYIGYQPKSHKKSCKFIPISWIHDLNCISFSFDFKSHSLYYTLTFFFFLFVSLLSWIVRKISCRFTFQTSLGISRKQIFVVKFLVWIHYGGFYSGKSQ